ncbi:MAG TPA: FtsX-like permease family protein [Caulobacteraceae bacterium]|nr:FtsX-like permease family protein [Caulobacteraceae bacterium]
MFRNYLAAALRNLERNSLYAGVTIAGLAIGFAAAMLIALYVRDELSYDRFVPGHEAIYRVSETIAFTGERPIESDTTPMLMAPSLKLEFPQVAASARLTGISFPPTVRHGDIVAAEQNLGWADPDFFRVMPLPALAGDPAGALDAPDGLVITRTIARKYFGRDTPLGETLLVDGHPMRITAVLKDLPSSTHLKADMFASGRSPYSFITEQEKVATPFNNTMATYIRLRPGASAASIEKGLSGFVDRHFPPALRGQTKITIHLVPLTDIHLRPSTQGAFKPAADRGIIAAIAAVGVLIVLVAAINFVTLMTARASRRAVEVGVRKASGATRRDLIVQFMGEAALYVLISAVFAVALAELLLPAFNAFLQRTITFDYWRDPLLAGSIVAAMLATALAAGAYPALVLSAFRPSSVLKGGLVSAGGGSLVRQGLVVVQFAVLVGLILGAATIARQTLFALNEGMRLDKDQVLFIAAKPCTDGMRDAMAALPGVKRAACASAQALALTDVTDLASVNGRQYFISLAPVDFGFFELYGIKPIAGRLFDRARPSDGYTGPSPVNPPIVLNETAVHKLGFASPSAALGKVVTWHFHTDLDTAYGNDPAQPSQIIGVVPDFTFGSMRQPIGAMMYMVGPKVSYDSTALNLKLDGRRVPETLQAIDGLWKRVGGGIAMQRYFVGQFTMRHYIDTIIQGATIAIASVIALSIACLGLFALSAYTAERRTKEIGIRKAMGASSADILRLLLWEFTKPVLVANLIAWPASWLVMDWGLKGFADHVDLPIALFLAAGAAAVVIAWLTVGFHAYLVARAKPVSALRYE